MLGGHGCGESPARYGAASLRGALDRPARCRERGDTRGTVAAPPPHLDGVGSHTGGLERVVTAALATAGLPVVVVHPRQARDCARATGQVAKTDAVAARALAHFADGIRPTPRPLPD